MKKLLMFLICTLLFTCMAFSASAFEIGARGKYWLPCLNGDIRVSGNGIDGTKLDLKDDLDMDEESYPVIEIFAGLGSHHLSLSYYSADYEGSKVLERAIDFNGQTYAVSTSIDTSLDYDVYEIMYQYDLLDLENVLAGFSLGPLFKLKIIDGSVEVKSDLICTSEDFTAPIPMLGINIHLGIFADILEARLYAAGISYDDGSVFDGQADISYTPFPFLDIHGGYRFFIMDVDAEDVEFNFNTSGPFVGLSVSF